MSLFRLTVDRSQASPTPVELGRSSVNTIEVVRGLDVGDCVVLMDMSHMPNTIGSICPEPHPVGRRNRVRGFVGFVGSSGSSGS